MMLIYIKGGRGLSVCVGGGVGGWYPSLGEDNESELNQQSALMLILFCLFNLIIKDRPPPLLMPEEQSIRAPPR